MGAAVQFFLAAAIHLWEYEDMQLRRKYPVVSGLVLVLCLVSAIDIRTLSDCCVCEPPMFILSQIWLRILIPAYYDSWSLVYPLARATSRTSIFRS